MKRLCLLLCTLLSSPLSLAANHIELQNPYARAMPAGAPTSAVFVTLINQSQNERNIVSATTPAAGKVELHTHIMQDNVMKMRLIPQITIPAGGKTVLKPGGLHIMLFDLQQPFDEGDSIEVTINFHNGESQTFTAPIKKVMQGMKMQH